MSCGQSTSSCCPPQTLHAAPTGCNPDDAVELLKLSGDTLGGGVLERGKTIPNFQTYLVYCDDCLPLTGLTFP